jgi:selenocysteine lyase/cysteine desulfurase
MTIDLERARRETPGCRGVLHFNNAGASLAPRPVLDAVIDHLELEAEIGGYEAADRARDARERTYDAVARLLGCARDEIALVESATRAWDMAFYALPLGPGDRILTSAAEYASNYLAFLQVAKRTRAVVEPVPSDATGAIDVEALRAALRRPGRVGLVALTHVPTNGGLVNPAAEVGRAARQAGAPFLLDACQSAGQIPLDVEELGCDMLSATGRKFLRAPRGTGFLYVRREWIQRLEPPFIDLHAATWTAPNEFELREDARRFESWESNVAGQIGLGVAVDYALGFGLAAIRDRVTALAALLRDRLSALPGVTVRDLGRERCGIVTLTVEGHDPAVLRDRLRVQRINVSVSAAAAARLDMEARGLQALLRASVHYYNSEEEVERFVSALRSLAEGPPC